MTKKLSIFISWSNDPSKEIAVALKKLLEQIFTDPNIEFFLSSSTNDGIVSGERFRNKLDNKLMESNFGILILTQNNFERPWIMFEAGALSKNTDESRIVPIIFNRDENKLESPIKNFQHIKYNKDDFKSLIFSIQKSLFKLSELTDVQEKKLKKELESHWLEFKGSVQEALDKIENEISELSSNVTSLMMDENAYENILPRRETQLEELIYNLKDDNSERIIIFGGISTILREEATIRKFVSWMTINVNSKLFICHENSAVATKRAQDLSDNAYKKEVNISNEIQKRKVIDFDRMREKFLSLIGEETKKNLYFIEISKTLTTYATIQGTTIYLTPVLNKRASNTFTFKLKKSKLNNQLLDYMSSRVSKELDDDKCLIKELENIKSEGNIDE